MGCSSGKEERVDIRHLRLQSIGVYSVDRFNDKLEDVIERFGKLTDDIERKRKRLDDLSGFSWGGKVRYGDGGIKKSVIGILLQFFAVGQGDLSKVKVSVIERKPFIKLSLNGLTVQQADKQIEAFEDYIDEINDCFEEKMPRIVQEMGELADRAVNLQAEAASEFDAMNEFSKMSSIAKCVKFVSDVLKIPAYMKQALKEVEGELN